MLEKIEGKDGPKIDDSGQVWPSEALYAFMGWLTARPKPVTFSVSNYAGEAVELIKQFVNNQGWAEPRDGWDKNIKPYSVHEGILGVLDPVPTIKSRFERELKIELKEQQTFDIELITLLYKYGHDTKHDTPDYVLAIFVQGAVSAFREALRARDNWVPMGPSIRPVLGSED